MTTRERLVAKVEALPPGPGVYLFKDAAGAVVYVGKAKSLRDRVRGYFRERGDGRLFVRFIELRVHDVEVVATRSEKEAFLLENNLIKQYKPRYNIRLKDDKSFLHLRVDAKHDFPAIVPMRRPRKDGARYFGPYASARCACCARSSRCATAATPSSPTGRGRASSTRSTCAARRASGS
jgi:excinuclease ABC subunit C